MIVRNLGGVATFYGLPDILKTVTEILNLNLPPFHRHTLSQPQIAPSAVLTSNRETLLSAELPSR